MSAVWSYCVVSSGPQAESLDHQRDWARRAAAEHGWEIEREFSGVASGAGGIRKLLEDLLGELRATPKAKRPERVLLIRIDRLGRGLAIEAVAALAEIHRLGVRLFTREDGDVRIERASDAITPMLRAITGALENEARRDKAVATYARKRRDGEVFGRPPYGLGIERGEYVADPATAPAVQEAYRLRVEGHGYYRIALQMRSVAGPQAYKNGRAMQPLWDAWQVARLLQRRAYVSAGLVDEATFAAAQPKGGPREVLQTRYPWPLSGVVRCECGAGLKGRATGPQRARTRYYVCERAALHPPNPRPRARRVDRAWVIMHNADRLEAQLVEILGDLVADPKLAVAFAQRELERTSVDGKVAGRRVAALEAEVADVDRRVETAWALAEGGGIEAEELKRRIDGLRKEQSEKQAELARLRSDVTAAEVRRRRDVDVAATVARIARVWARSPAPQQKLFVRQFTTLIGPLVATYSGRLELRPS